MRGSLSYDQRTGNKLKKERVRAVHFIWNALEDSRDALYSLNGASGPCRLSGKLERTAIYHAGMPGMLRIYFVEITDQYPESNWAPRVRCNLPGNCVRDVIAALSIMSRGKVRKRLWQKAKVVKVRIALFIVNDSRRIEGPTMDFFLARAIRLIEESRTWTHEKRSGDPSIIENVRSPFGELLVWEGKKCQLYEWFESYRKKKAWYRYC